MMNLRRINTDAIFAAASIFNVENEFNAIDTSVTTHGSFKTYIIHVSNNEYNEHHKTHVQH